jgi:hypothetical protein
MRGIVASGKFAVRRTGRDQYRKIAYENLFSMCRTCSAEAVRVAPRHDG